MPQFCPDYDAISKKKVLHQNSNGFFSQNQVISKRRSHMLISKCHLIGPFRAFLKPMGSLMGPPKSMGPTVIIPPAPPLSVALLSSTQWCVLYIYCPSTSLPCVTTDSDKSSSFICASSRLPVPY